MQAPDISNAGGCRARSGGDDTAKPQPNAVGF